VREETVVIGKGVHTPLCYPGVIARQLTVSLDRMKADCVDIYFMHRDNPDIPVGEFVDAMDPEVKAGRIRGPFGGSNWTRERFDEAIAYAEKTGKTRPSVLSNNFSLAEMVDPVWAGCIASTGKEWMDCSGRRGSPTSPGPARRAASSPKGLGAARWPIPNLRDPGIPKATLPAATGPSILENGSARIRPRWRLPMCSHKRVTSYR
jgi:hypothetical protein